MKSVKSGKAEFSEKVNPKEAKERVKLANGPPKPKGIPEGAVQGLVCEACMKKYSKISQTTTTTTTQKVTGFVQMTSGARIPGKETTVETTETKSEVKPFRRCMKYVDHVILVVGGTFDECVCVCVCVGRVSHGRDEKV